MDVLEQLGFLDANILSGSNPQGIYNALRNNLNSHRLNLLIEAPPSYHNNVSADIQMNLFKILCAV